MEVFYKNKPAPSFKPIPITKQESISQENESIMKFNSKLNRFLNKQVEVFSKNIVDLGQKIRM
ncbi:13337_t:CDS:1, partial [Entrophospora sp. SA101]